MNEEGTIIIDPYADHRALALRLLQEQAETDCPRCAHQEADSILCALLVALGYQDVVDAWQEVPKLYS